MKKFKFLKIIFFIYCNKKMTMTLRSGRDGSRKKVDGLLVTDSELDSFRQGYSKDQRQAININQPVKAYKGRNGMIQFVPYSVKKDIKKKVPAMLDQDFDNTKASAQAEIIAAGGANATWPTLTAQQKSDALKQIRKLQKVSLSIGMVDDKQWEQIFEDLKIKTKPLKNQNTTDYKDMREEVDKRIREYAGKRSKDGFAKTVKLDDEEYKKYINKYLKSVRNYYMEENDLKVVARPLFTTAAAANRNVYVNLAAAPAAGAGLAAALAAGIVNPAGAGAGADAANNFVIGSGINPESTPTYQALGGAANQTGLYWLNTQHAVRSFAADPAVAGIKPEPNLLTILTNAAGMAGARGIIAGAADTGAGLGGAAALTDAERSAMATNELQRFEKSRDIIKTQFARANDLSAAGMGTTNSQISVFSDGVYYNSTNENDKSLKALQQLIEKLFKIFIDRTKHFLEENPDADATWLPLNDGGKGKKHAKKSAKSAKSARGKKAHSGSKKHKKKRSGGK